MTDITMRDKVGRVGVEWGLLIYMERWWSEGEEVTVGEEEWRWLEVLGVFVLRTVESASLTVW